MWSYRFALDQWQMREAVVSNRSNSQENCSPYFRTSLNNATQPKVQQWNNHRGNSDFFCFQNNILQNSFWNVWCFRLTLHALWVWIQWGSCTSKLRAFQIKILKCFGSIISSAAFLCIQSIANPSHRVEPVHIFSLYLKFTFLIISSVLVLLFVCVLIHTTFTRH